MKVKAAMAIPNRRFKICDDIQRGRMPYHIGTDGIIYPRPFAQQRARLAILVSRRSVGNSDRTLILYKNEEAIVAPPRWVIRPYLRSFLIRVHDNNHKLAFAGVRATTLEQSVLAE